MYDVFLCHASENKSDVVIPLAAALEEHGISYWLDNEEIGWGDSITAKVNDGLAKSRFVVLVLSAASLEKHWQQREINAMLNREAASGEVRTLPLFVGSPEEIRTVIERYPLLNDKRYLQWEGDTALIVQALAQRLGRTADIGTTLTDTKTTPSPRAIPMPRPKRKIGDLEKDRFIKGAFSVIKGYFEDGLKQLENEYPEVTGDLTDIHNFKFISKIYVGSDLKAQRKIWLGGIGGSHAISYAVNAQYHDNDNSYNGWVSVADDGYEMFLKGTALNFQGDSPEKLTPDETAEMLWRGFVAEMSY